MRRVGDPAPIFSVFHELFARGAVRAWTSLVDAKAKSKRKPEIGLSGTPLFTGPNWDFGGLRKVHDAIERIAVDEMGLDTYPLQIEVITSEQMLDAYASVGRCR